MAPPTHSAVDSQLIEDLHKLSLVNRKLVKSTPYTAPADPSIMVRSWKMNEFKYYEVPSPFPTLARGLFSTEYPSEDGRATSHRIVLRGYDKFFNIGEVPWTTWASLEERTAPPYVLTLKSNGCIIFIAALTPTKLLITSKHAVGGGGGSLNHAEAGEQWLRRYLFEKERTEEQLASVLWQKNWTAIAELCDDSFEEHVLGYPPDKTGLHLHGINESTKAFKTLPQAEVDAFADEWGFIKTHSIVLQSIPDVKTFTDEIAKTGKWNDEAVEGFVVRTHVSAPREGATSTSASPYPPGATFFFKVKFDEPYMMYRDWRELTKTLLSTTGNLNRAKLSTMRMKRPETRLYVKWVTEQIEKDRGQFDQYSKGKGIIRTRENFLKWLEAEKSKDTLKLGEETTSVDVAPVVQENQAFGKTIIVPIAIPGCGKTAVSVALQHIFGFGHTQSDDVRVKKAAPAFVRNVVNLLHDYDVVIADKNNHLRQHREALRHATSGMSPPVRLLALYWSLDIPHATIRRICCDRIIRRGENHQTLRADTKDKTHEDIVWQFIGDSEELLSNEVDACIELDVTATLEESVQKAVEGCVRMLGVPAPSPAVIAEALNKVNQYTVTSKKTSRDKDEKRPVPRYFGLLPEANLEKIVDEALKLKGDLTEDSAAFWAELKKTGRVTKRPHVTITHQKYATAEKELWEQCLALHRLNAPPVFKFDLGSIMWNDRVMAATVENLALDDGDGDVDARGLAQELTRTLPNFVKERLHITIGTRNAQIPALEGMLMVREPTGDETVVKLDEVTLKGRLSGLFT